MHYIKAVNWKLPDIPNVDSNLIVYICEPTGPFLECGVVFLGRVGSDAAGEIEMAFLKAHIHPMFSKCEEL